MVFLWLVFHWGFYTSPFWLNWIIAIKHNLTVRKEIRFQPGKINRNVSQWATTAYLWKRCEKSFQNGLLDIWIMFYFFCNFTRYFTLSGTISKNTKKAPVLLMTAVCWWLYDGDSFEMFVSEPKDKRLNVVNSSPTSLSRHQHISSPTSVTNIDNCYHIGYMI